MNRCAGVLLLSGLLAFALPAADTDKPLEPVNLPINTAKDEDDPHVASTHLTLYFVTNANKKLEIMAATRKTVNDPWAAAGPVPYFKSKDSDFRSPFVTPEGKYPQRFYCSSNVDPLAKGAKGENYDIYTLLKVDAKAEYGGLNSVNPICTELDEMHPWVTPDDRHVYFSRRTEGGWRQFMASRPADGGQFGAPVQLKLPLGYHHATLTPDGKTMYLQGPVESSTKTRRWGLYVSTSKDGKTWERPQPLTRLNHATAPQGDMSPSLSRDGKMLYFASDRPGGKGGLDIWAIPTAELKP
ncbi:hypothetical protein AYO44_07975 [Planctomycetaceae bacterium SCGC AG-212-F19]|nr:hypothetical protein AYO44_07975 [Planctomycetaceae bacterium SCGC AG-212-F19]